METGGDFPIVYCASAAVCHKYNRPIVIFGQYWRSV